MEINKFIFFLLLSVIFLPGCDKHQAGGDDDKPVGKRQTLQFTPIEELNAGEAKLNSHAGLTGRSTLSPIADTYVQLGKDVTNEDKPVYPRFAKTGSGDYMMFYHYGNESTWAGNECEYLRSNDLVSWTNYKKLFPVYAITDCTGKSNKRGYAGPHPLLLANGDLMVVAATRAISSYRDRNADNGLSIRISHDGGNSWDEEKIVFVGTNWEPMPLQLSSGRIQIYYTDSKKLFGSSAFGAGQEVISTGSSYIYSDDNGKTWQPSDPLNGHLRAFAQVRYRNGDEIVLTDQMPAVIELAGTKKLAAAAESFIGGSKYETYISLAYSDENGNWGSPDSDGVLPKDRKDKVFLGCAPYLVQFPSGETVLSYNQNSYFYMRQGNENAEGFGDAIKVFAQTAATGKGFWGSMYCFDSHRMVAGVGGSNVIQVGQFYLNHSITAANHAVKMDGNNTDWKTTDEALYLCSLGATKSTVRCSADADKVYFLFDVVDKDISKDDYVQIFFSNPEKSELSSGAVRVKASYLGLKTAGPYAGGWRESDIGAEVASSYDGTPGLNVDEDHGYVVEIAVPRKSLPIKDGELLVNPVLFDIKNGGEDAIVPTADKSTEKWICVSGL